MREFRIQDEIVNQAPAEFFAPGSYKDNFNRFFCCHWGCKEYFDMCMTHSQAALPHDTSSNSRLLLNLVSFKVLNSAVHCNAVTYVSPGRNPGGKRLSTPHALKEHLNEALLQSAMSFVALVPGLRPGLE